MVCARILVLFASSFVLVACTRVQLICHDKAQHCAEEGSEKVCGSDLSKLVCRRTCNYCTCLDAVNILCKKDDICHSAEGRMLCPRTCDACEFRILDKDWFRCKGKGSDCIDGFKDSFASNIDGNRLTPNNSTNHENPYIENESTHEGGSAAGKMEDCLTYHNEYREKHKDTPHMTWDQTIATGAQKYAEKLASTETMKHASPEERDGAGENLSMRGSTQNFKDSACKHAVDAWYEEIKDFDFNTKSGRGTGHFTQVVWKKSMKLGCGFGTRKNGDMHKEYVVCRYMDAGNFRGEYESNVGDLVNGEAKNRDTIAEPSVVTATALKRHIHSKKHSKKHA